MNFFAECSLRVGAILTATFLITLALRKQQAALRHVVWVAAFGISALTPLLFAWGPQAVEPVTAVAALASVPIAIEVAAAKATEEPRDGSERMKDSVAASQMARMGERNRASTLWKKGCCNGEAQLAHCHSRLESKHLQFLHHGQKQT